MDHIRFQNEFPDEGFIGNDRLLLPGRHHFFTLSEEVLKGGTDAGGSKAMAADTTLFLIELRA
jgi:hypothetical protein